MANPQPYGDELAYNLTLEEICHVAIVYSGGCSHPALGDDLHGGSMFAWCDRCRAVAGHEEDEWVVPLVTFATPLQTVDLVETAGIEPASAIA